MGGDILIGYPGRVLHRGSGEVDPPTRRYAA